MVPLWLGAIGGGGLYLPNLCFSRESGRSTLDFFHSRLLPDPLFRIRWPHLNPSFKARGGCNFRCPNLLPPRRSCLKLQQLSSLQQICSGFEPFLFVNMQKTRKKYVGQHTLLNFTDRANTMFGAAFCPNSHLL